MTAEAEEPRATPAELAARDFMRWRAGDPTALERLVRRVTPTLWHIARAYGLSRDSAEDVVQASWLALARAADSVRDPQAVLSWLYVTTRREALRVSRGSRREHSVEPGELGEALHPEPGLEDDVVADEEARTLWRLVARLSPRCQRLLRVVAFEDRPDYRSLSTELAMPVGGIGPTRRRCLDKLRTLLADDPEWSRQ
jgi:RNA polymerase sigma factor (sigma-70 family)